MKSKLLAREFDRQLMLNQEPVDIELCIANSFVARFKGLLFSTISQSQGLEIKPCKDIHSFGMRYSIDVVFLSKDSKVIKLGRLKPNRIFTCSKADSVIELAEGSIKRLAIKLGDQLTHRCVTKDKEVIV